jgi:hypothetical protein
MLPAPARLVRPDGDGAAVRDHKIVTALTILGSLGAAFWVAGHLCVIAAGVWSQ